MAYAELKSRCLSVIIVTVYHGKSELWLNDDTQTVNIDHGFKMRKDLKAKKPIKKPTLLWDNVNVRHKAEDAENKYSNRQNRLAIFSV